MIDAHHHFWRYVPEEYPWIGESLAMIARDFGPAELLAVTPSAGVDRVVSVQARQSVTETEWLLELARSNPFIAGVVGWAPLVDADDEGLARLAANPKLKAMRHVIHDEPDDQFILREDFNRGVAVLDGVGLAYDILIFEKHLPQTIAFVDQHPTTRFIVDHVAKPRIADREIEPWKTEIARLAERPNVYCKVSGMVTEADWRNWTPEQLRPYFDAALSAFGPERLMFGSDWPVCLVACEYGRWAETVKQWTDELSESEQESIHYKTAVEAYRLSD